MQAQTCSGVVDCFNFGTPPPQCSDPNGTVTCNGTVMTVCTAPSANSANASLPDPAQLHAFSYDCSTTGGTCVPPSTASQSWPAGCAAGTCGADLQRCDDSTHFSTCAHGRLDVGVCASGTTCTESGGYVGCTSPTSCDPSTFRGSCSDATVAGRCESGAVMLETCRPGTTCQVAPSGTSFCGVASECAPLDEIPLCADTAAVKVCSFGRWKTVSCGDVGFSACQPADLTLRHGAVCH
jgi:hypothetical protein